MSQNFVEPIERIQKGVRSFAADMRAQGIHVGLGSPPACVTCGLPWKRCQEIQRAPAGLPESGEETDG